MSTPVKCMCGKKADWDEANASGWISLMVIVRGAQGPGRGIRNDYCSESCLSRGVPAIVQEATKSQYGVTKE